ncbi:MAG: type II toxin-antitoxin system CcdA family antitoxin [Burkholderiaceae bacterium]|nr:type II toxin-antitoxin system CcdA family antitoxin [Burkholderiaceae bacterium]
MKHVVRERSVLYDVSAPKRATNVTVNADLLRRAREFDVNLSQTLEFALVAEVKRCARERWLAENRAAIDAYNEDVERNGCFGDPLRAF